MRRKPENSYHIQCMHKSQLMHNQDVHVCIRPLHLHRAQENLFVLVTYIKSWRWRATLSCNFFFLNYNFDHKYIKFRSTILWCLSGHNNFDNVIYFSVTDFHPLTSIREKSIVLEGTTSLELLCPSKYQDIIVYPYKLMAFIIFKYNILF